MNFVAPYFLIGSLVALLYGALLLLGAVRAKRSRQTFGDAKRIDALVTFDSSKRRAWKGVFLVVATALAFFAAARPQYGKGQRLIPATNVDVVVALDYSKSMYARDVEPSRIFRAKVEVGKLVTELRGARFAAVAFAGDAIGFPLTADGSAIAQFFRQLEPNDMPVGGTAIARALEQARELLRRDPSAKDHKKFIVLITDGEDLEGSPLSVARSIDNDQVTIYVVQIGGRTSEPIPNIGDNGEVLGWRTTDDGRPMTTELTPQGERQLESIAKATKGGKYIRADKGSTGIDDIASDLRDQMKTKYAEKVETVYADVYMYPLLACIVLLLLEAFVSEAPRRSFLRNIPPAAVAKLPRGVMFAGMIGPSPTGGPSPLAGSKPEGSPQGAPQPPVGVPLGKSAIASRDSSTGGPRG